MAITFPEGIAEFFHRAIPLNNAEPRPLNICEPITGTQRAKRTGLQPFNPPHQEDGSSLSGDSVAGLVSNRVAMILRLMSIPTVREGKVKAYINDEAVTFDCTRRAIIWPDSWLPKDNHPA